MQGLSGGWRRVSLSLERFIQAQDAALDGYGAALAELRGGLKETHAGPFPLRCITGRLDVNHRPEEVQ